MKRNDASNSRRHAIVGSCLAIAFLWALALSASPQLHRIIHVDAGQPEHSCAVTLLSSGSYEHSVDAPISRAHFAPDEFSTLPALTPEWVRSQFLGACIFEHAPPANS